MAPHAPEGAAGSSAPLYTPGPWSIADRGGRLLIDSAKHFVATVPFGDAAAMADARLIAASPDLLTALQAMLGEFGEDRYGPSVTNAVSLAHAAIAKAEGRT